MVVSILWVDTYKTIETVAGTDEAQQTQLLVWSMI